MSHLAHPTRSPPVAHVLPAILIVRLALGPHSISVRAVHPIGLYFRMAAVFRRAPRLNSSIVPPEVANSVMVVVRVAPVPDQATASRAQVRPRSSVEGLVYQRTAVGAERPLFPDSVSVSRISSPSRKCQALPSPSRFPPSRALIVQL